MADSTIFDLTPEAVLTPAHEFVTQDTSAATRAQAATFALMGGLAYSAASVTTANVTATVGTLHGLDLSGLTADRNFVLPDSAQVGERVGVFVTVGDADFELDLVTAATGSLINGANAGGGTSWSRLFIDNECVIFRCIKAGGAGDTDWIVEYDGRIPCVCMLRKAADQTGVTASTFTKVTLDAEDIDVGDIGDPTTNNRITIRRAGNYSISILSSCSLSDTDRIVIGTVYLNTSETFRVGRAASHAGTTAVSVSGGIVAPLAIGDDLELYVWHNATGNETAGGGAASVPDANRMSVQEIF